MSSSSTLPLPPPNSPTLHAALGGILIGPFISTWIFGVYSLQLYIYWISGFKDGWILRTLVLFVFILEALHTAEMWNSVYEILVRNYGNLDVLINLPLSMRLATIPSDGMAISIQLFFASRIRTLSLSFKVPVILWALAVIRTMFAFVTTIQSVRVSPVSKFFAEWSWAPLGMVSVGCLSDIIIAISMTYYLQRNKGQLKRTAEVLNKLSLIAVEAGIFTTILGIALLITMALMPGNSAWPGIFFVYAKSYSISLMVSLNARKSLRSHLLSGTGSDSIDMSGMPRSSMNFQSTGRTTGTATLETITEAVVKIRSPSDTTNSHHPEMTQPRNTGSIA